MPCKRWNSNPLLSPLATSRIVAAVYALCVANCGYSTSRASSILIAHALYDTSVVAFRVNTG